MNQQTKLSAELAKWAWLRPRLEAEDFDAVGLMTCLESETDIKECLLEIAESALEDEASVSVIRERIKALQERCGRLDARAEKKRRIVTFSMEQAGIENITAPTMTLSLRKGGRELVVIDLDQIPGEFFEYQAPKLKRRELRDALNERGPISGAQLSNGSSSVTIRTR